VKGLAALILVGGFNHLNSRHIMLFLFSCPTLCLQGQTGQHIKKESRFAAAFLKIVGVAGFEPTASCSQSRRDTGLRYTPKNTRKPGILQCCKYRFIFRY
jgi:hypothetical protein